MAPELLTVQRSGGGVPVVQVTLSDRLAGLPRLRWQRLYTGLEDDFHHASVCSGNGTLVRARATPSGQAYLQIITTPAAGSPFGTWTLIGTLSPVSGVALTAAGSSVLLFLVAPDQRTILCSESTDNGQSFGAGVVVVTAPAAVTYLTAGVSAGGVVRLFYNVGGTVYSVARTAGVGGPPRHGATPWRASAGWRAPTAWTGTWW